MTKTTLNKISKNPNLVAFCNKILSYNAIFENEMTRSMFFVSLISSDCLIDTQSCDETIEISKFILDHIDLFVLDNNLKKEVIKYCKSAIKIAKRDKKQFEYELIKDYR